VSARMGMIKEKKQKQSTNVKLWVCRNVDGWENRGYEWGCGWEQVWGWLRGKTSQTWGCGRAGTRMVQKPEGTIGVVGKIRTGVQFHSKVHVGLWVCRSKDDIENRGNEWGSRVQDQVCNLEWLGGECVDHACCFWPYWAWPSAHCVGLARIKHTYDFAECTRYFRQEHFHIYSHGIRCVCTVLDNPDSMVVLNNTCTI
jgi:hypothetical protein